MKLLLLCLTVWCASAHDMLYSWKTKEKPYNKIRLISVPESTLVDEDNKQMLMMANDTLFRLTPIYRSTSLHDFKNGIVGLKPEGANKCFVGPVKANYRKTLRELAHRVGENCERKQRRRPMKVDTTNTDLITASDAVNAFCYDLDLIWITKMDLPLDHTPPWIRWPPLRCIWGPVDIYWPIDLELPPFMADWEGPFWPFP